VASLEIRKSGWLTTIQDAGRWGLQGRGVPVSGPMDWYAHQLANRLVGNSAEAAAIESAMGGPEIVFDGDAWFALTGAEFPARLNGRPIPGNRAVPAPAGASLVFGLRSKGAWGYLAVSGGLAVPAVLGSRATHVVARLGGLAGRPLRAGDRIEVGPATSTVDASRRLPPLPLPDGGARLRVLPGPDLNGCRPDRSTAQATGIVGEPDRMGYRPDGPASQPPAGDDFSGATVTGRGPDSPVRTAHRSWLTATTGAIRLPQS
jgi:antagonist of KipI